jgi:23S rRNA pseudouridine1911/1915/1917 synthase
MQQPHIIYEDQNLLAVVKPAGMLVHATRQRATLQMDSDGATPYTLNPKPEKTLVDWLLERYPELREVGDPSILRPGSGQASSGQAIYERPGIVHRLDRETSGVMVVAKTQKAFEYLKSLFQKHEIKKTYLAVARGEFKEKTGLIDMPIGLKNGTIKRTVHGGRMVKEAVTEYEVLREMRNEKGDMRMGNGETMTLLRVMPKTGRTHQIRIHLASIGHPIIGDTIYGKNLKAKSSKLKATGIASRLMLHALSLEFTSPDGKRMKIESEIPEEFNV